jgi:selenocysteine lyase/cysteine desulfurase
LTPDSEFSLPDKSRAGFARIDRKATTKSDLEPPAAKKSAIGSGSALEDSGGAVRVGIVHYNTADEVDLLLGELETA